MKQGRRGHFLDLTWNLTLCRTRIRQGLTLDAINLKVAEDCEQFQAEEAVQRPPNVLPQDSRLKIKVVGLRTLS